MKILTTAFVFLICSILHGQTNYQNLLDTAINEHAALFVCSKPLNNIQLDSRDMWRYVEYLKERSKQNLDTFMFSQIIANSKTCDTSNWKDTELPKSLFIDNRETTVDKEYAIQKFQLTDKTKIKSYKKLINEYNFTDTYKRNLYYYSRPVFNNSKTFAIVQWDNAHNILNGGGGISLYNLQSGQWQEIGIITDWQY